MQWVQVHDITYKAIIDEINYRSIPTYTYIGISFVINQDTI